MGLDDLVARIELLQARIRSHKAALRENETRTRMALIDPLMPALGWDVSDPRNATHFASIAIAFTIRLGTAHQRCGVAIA